MVDAEKLRIIIKDRGLKYKHIASQLGLSPYGLQRKINGETDFKASEITKMTKLLCLSKTQRDNIFLTE